MKKTLLMIAWHFPPANHTASKRSGCFAKYLRRLGWKILVLTPRWTPENCDYDEEYVRNLQADIVREEISYAPFVSEGLPSTLKHKVKCFLWPQRIPHDWVDLAQQGIDRLFREHRIDCIWATFPGLGGLPLHLADQAARKWGVPWVADFRDIPGQIRAAPLLYRLRVPIERYHQRKVVPGAGEIVTVSRSLAKRLGRWHGRHVRVIENGFDPEDFDLGSGRQAQTSSRFDITYMGNFAPWVQSPRPVLDALRNLIRRGEIDGDRVRVHFYGTKPASLRVALAGFEMPQLVERHDRVDAATAIRKIEQASVLLLLALRQDAGVPTSKLYEYMASGRPILAFPRDGGSVEARLAETGAGLNCDTVVEVEAALLDWWGQWKASGAVASRIDPTAGARFSRREQAARLDAILGGVVEAGGGPGQARREPRVEEAKR
jgi:glycosyltransferase involved in cell wall biosynthesis